MIKEIVYGAVHQVLLDLCTKVRKSVIIRDSEESLRYFPFAPLRATAHTLRFAQYDILISCIGLFLPKYSPDLNDIEQDFSALKRARMYAPSDKLIDKIIREYCAR